MSRDVSSEPVFTLSDIQGDILMGLPKRAERLIFFRIVEPAPFRELLASLPITSAGQVLAWRDEITFRKSYGNDKLLPTPGLKVAFCFQGLACLGVNGLDAVPALKQFCAGMAASRQALSDPALGKNTILKEAAQVHGVFILTGSDDTEINNTFSQRFALQRASWEIVEQEDGRVRSGNQRGHEHFGFADGVSQPGLRGRIGPDRPLVESVPNENDHQGALGQDLLWPGEFVIGHLSQNPATPPFFSPGIQKPLPHPMMPNGSFLVFRKLSQKVPEFNAMLARESDKLRNGNCPSSPDLLGAQMVGRWKNGAPIVRAPMAEDPAIAAGTPFENDFEFGNDREGFKCPWAAHVRKAYPRDELRTGTTDVDKEEALTQTHRMLRRGITYGPELTQAEADQGVTLKERGLLFKCYVSSIADQFEFVQRVWMNNTEFPQVASGADPLLGQGATAKLPFTGACPVSNVQTDKPVLHLERFVHFEGGEYFFSPSVSQLISGFADN